MNALDQGFYDELSTASAFNTAVGGRIHHRQALEGSAYPLCIFGEQTGIDGQVFAGRSQTNRLYLVKVVDEDELGEDAGSAYELADAALEGATLTISGHRQIGKVQREQTIGYSETKNGRTYWHEGGIYRVVTQATG